MLSGTVTKCYSWWSWREKTPWLV
uniref:Uncharacterized protein n=1 Tax=Anguilla anguilla TaxID=7936 RepID=A0A0E9PXW0_ANGAN